MTSRNWIDLQSVTIAGHVVVGKLVFAGRQSALSKGRIPGNPDTVPSGAAVPGENESTTSTVISIVLRRCALPAAAHPVVLILLSLGFDDHESLVYTVAERNRFACSFTPRYSPRGPCRLKKPANWANQQLVSALSYLHDENFVFCNLRPASIWKVGDELEPADFSQVAG